MDEGRSSASRVATVHALAWLVVGNLVGLWLSILLLKPEWNLGEFSYGRFVPIHLNVQLYGWTAMPLVAWLFSIYEVDRSKAAGWGIAAVWAWSGALTTGLVSWLGGMSSGKIFLDWKSGALWCFVVALAILWAVLAVAWWERRYEWGKTKRLLTTASLVGLACVPVAMLIASSPAVYPPIDRTTGGPTGSSLLGSTLVVIGLMLLLPRMAGVRKVAGRDLWKWIFFVACWVVFAVTESMGGTHFDSWQILAMLFLVPWAYILPKDWAGFSWPEGTAAWRVAAMGWWGVLVASGVMMYFPRLLDRLKFTQGLVAHSHLAMAGFTTSFVVLLMVLVRGKRLGGTTAVVIWNAAALGMIAVLAWMGWREGGGAEWMLSDPAWRASGLAFRAGCGFVMFLVSVFWLKEWTSERRAA